MEHETILLILSFLIGWVGHAVYSFVANLGRTAYLVRITAYSCMCFAKLISDQTIEFLEVKYKSLSELGVNTNKVKLMRNEDRISIEAMQGTIVKLINDNYPKPFTHQIEIKNWKQMVQHIGENHRRNNA